MRTYKKIISYLILVVFALFALYPFLWSLLASFHGDPDILKGDVVFSPYTLKHYMDIVFDDPLFMRWIFNSLFIAVIGTIVTVTCNTLAGYALARMKFRGNKFILGLVLVVMVVPGQCLMIPNYVIVNRLGLIDSYFAFWIPGLVSAMYIYMMVQFFKNLPPEVEEAAYIDGLGRWGILSKIAAPMARPAIVAQSIFIFMGYWNTFQPSILYMQSREMFSLQHGLMTFQNTNSTSWGIIMAGAMISMVPILFIYIFANKYFISGLTFGGGK